jgi:branched-chain amino acid transport system substrate-binding protein
MSKSTETKILLLTLLLTATFVGVGFEWLINNFGLDLKNWLTASKHQSFVNIPVAKKITERISIGDKILIAANATEEKKSGVKAFAKKDYAVAINLLQLSLKKQPNDPETLIYLNNAQVANSNPLEIAVSIPIAKNLDVSQEILRGVSQSQQEINQQGGVNNKLLQVTIASDDNDPLISQQLAREFVNNRRILAVIGHQTSEATIAAAPIYEKGGLVMISPTSHAKQISELGDYIFRTVPSVRFQADTLSRYALKEAKKKNLSICFDSQSEYSKSLKEDFTSAILEDGGRIIQTNCDFSEANFEPKAVISRAINKGVNALLLAPAVNKIQQAIAVAKENQNRLTLIGSQTLYQIQTIKQGQSAVKNMMLAVPWHPDAFPDEPFVREATKLWKARVSWRTALAYDAAEVAIAGTKAGKQDRKSLQQFLADPNFSIQGATGTVEFLPSGDRDGAAIPITIKSDLKSQDGYSFVLLK